MRALKRPIRRTIIPPANEERNPTNAPAGEEIDHICLFGPFVRVLQLNAEAFVEKERQEGSDDKQCDAGQQPVPSDLFEK